MSNQHQPIGNGAVFKLPPSSASALVTDDIDVAHLMDTMSGDFGSLTLAGVGDEISSLGQILGLGPVAAAAAAATAATSAVGGSTTTTTTTTTTGTAVTVLDQGKATAGPGLALPQVIVPESDLMTIDVTELDLGHTEESMNDLEELIFKDSQGHNAVSTTMPPVNMVAGGRQMNAAATAAVSMIKQEPAATAAATAAAPVAAMTDGRRKRPHDPVQSELEWKNQLQMMQRMRQQELEDMGILPSVREGQPARPVLRIVNQPYPVGMNTNVSSSFFFDSVASLVVAAVPEKEIQDRRAEKGHHKERNWKRISFNSGAKQPSEHTSLVVNCVFCPSD